MTLLLGVCTEVLSKFLLTNQYVGICVRVIDGDSLIVQYFQNAAKKNIRLSYIDAPELSQLSVEGKKIGLMSKNFLESLVLGKQITLKVLGKGYYGRPLVDVIFNDQSINLALVTAGMALLYPYAVFQSGAQKADYLREFYGAQMRQTGIWNTQGFLSPARYRKRYRKRQGKK